MKNEWISVKEKLPMHMQDVLISHNEDKWISIGYWNLPIGAKHGEHRIWYNSYDNQTPCYPTHWQPLPEPPIS